MQVANPHETDFRYYRVPVEDDEDFDVCSSDQRVDSIYSRNDQLTCVVML